MNNAPLVNTPPSPPAGGQDGLCASPFAQEWVTIPKQEQIALIHQANYWKAQHAQLKEKFRKLEESNQHKDAKIKDLQNRLFGKKSEKSPTAKSEKSESSTDSPRKRGRQKGSPAHGRTPRPHLPVVDEVIDLSEEDKRCPHCGLAHRPRPGLTQAAEIIEVEVKAHKRRIIRPAYERHPNCTCPDVPAIITAPPLPRLIPRSPYGVSFWVEALLSKFEYAQPTHRYLQDLKHRGLPVSPGTVAGGLKAIAPLFEPLVEALYQKQMAETLFHNDETRWLVFVEIEGKVGYRWYLWMTRSDSVVMFDLDPSRSTAVPGAHFAGLQNG
jgi:transposase